MCGGEMYGGKEAWRGRGFAPPPLTTCLGSVGERRAACCTLAD